MKTEKYYKTFTIMHLNRKLSKNFKRLFTLVTFKRLFDCYHLRPPSTVKVTIRDHHPLSEIA